MTSQEKPFSEFLKLVQMSVESVKNHRYKENLNFNVSTASAAPKPEKTSEKN